MSDNLKEDLELIKDRLDKLENKLEHIYQEDEEYTNIYGRKN